MVVAGPDRGQVGAAMFLDASELIEPSPLALVLAGLDTLGLGYRRRTGA